MTQVEFFPDTLRVQSRANLKLGMISRAFATRDPVVLTSIYKRYVMPILCHGSSIGNPIYSGQAEELERIQQRFVRIVLGKGQYEEKRILHWDYTQ